MHVALISGSAEHRPIEEACLELRRNGHAVLLAGNGVAHTDLCPRPLLDEDETVAAIDQIVVFVVAALPKVEALRRDAVGRV
jgi:hypothetical protein